MEQVGNAECIDYVTESKKEEKCSHQDDIINIEELIIRHNLDTHKWYRQIQDDVEAKKDFDYNFGGLIKQMICAYACKDRYECPTIEKYLPKEEDRIVNKINELEGKLENCVHIEFLNKIQMKVIKDNLNNHRWFRHIEEDTTAMVDFLNDFSGIMREVICGYICCDRLRCNNAEKYTPKDIDIIKKICAFEGSEVVIYQVFTCNEEKKAA